MNKEVDTGNYRFFKYLTVKKLKQLLRKLDNNLVLAPNDVRNLAIFEMNGEEFKYVGIIDFLLEGEVQLHERERMMTEPERKIEDIPTNEIEQDLADQAEEIEDWTKEKDLLMKNPPANKVRIYILEGYISGGRKLAEKLRNILARRIDEKDSGKKP